MQGPDIIPLGTPRGRRHQVEGHHHIHMDEPAAIAETIQSFIPEQEAIRHGEPQ